MRFNAQRATVVAATIVLMLSAGDSRVSAKVETIRGTLVDKACFERNPKNIGQKHVDRPIDECAMACAKYGLPLAVRTADGKLYQVVGDLTAKRNAQIFPHVTLMVEATGEITTDEEGGLRIAATSLKPLGK